MKIKKGFFILFLGLNTVVHAQEDLSLNSNRDVIEKMPLISLQPMLDFCRDRQPQMNTELDQAYQTAKLKLIAAVQAIRFKGVEPLKAKDIDLSVDAQFKQQLESMLEGMSRSLQSVNATTFCSAFIERLNHFDQAQFQRIVELQYQKYLEQAQPKE
ncbi:hypothetical protein [Acinetobacter sp. YH01024]|uniref:hypothetical protein n=1 Tax=Acinetobacter sp. YH01024 TaxID=2601037 RepID=UPI0015D45E4B|nr:hypothetical protein [Acinetobacter sp. YH01024]